MKKTMVSLLILICLLFQSYVYAAPSLVNVTNSPVQLACGNTIITDFKNVITLYATGDDSTGAYTTLRRVSATSGYQVTSGKKLRIFCFIGASTGSDPVSWEIGQGDTDVGLSSVSAPTNFIPMLAGKNTTTDTAVLGSVQMFVEIAATKYATVKHVSSGSNGTIRGTFLAYEY